MLSSNPTLILIRFSVTLALHAHDSYTISQRTELAEYEKACVMGINVL